MATYIQCTTNTDNQESEKNILLDSVNQTTHLKTIKKHVENQAMANWLINHCLVFYMFFLTVFKCIVMFTVSNKKKKFHFPTYPGWLCFDCMWPYFSTFLYNQFTILDIFSKLLYQWRETSLNAVLFSMFPDV